MSKQLRASVLEKVNEYNDYHVYECSGNHNHIVAVPLWIIVYVINFFIISYKVLTIMKLSYLTHSARS